MHKKRVNGLSKQNLLGGRIKTQGRAWRNRKTGSVFGLTVLLVAAGIMTIWQATPAHAANNMAAYWKFDETTAGTTAADGSGNGNNLSPVNNPVPSTDIPTGMNVGITDARSASLNGSSQYFTAPDSSSLDATGAVTLATWVKFTSITGAYQTIVSKWNIGVAQQWTLQLNSDGHIGWWTGNGSTGADDLETSGTMSAGTWYHIVVTATGTSKQIYVNGSLDGSKTNASVSLGAATSVGVGIGGKAAGSVEYLNGKVDDTRLYARVLTASEASSLAAGNEATTLNGGSAVANELNATSTISDLQVSTTAASPTVYVKLYVSQGKLSLSTTTGLTFYDAKGASLGNTQPTNATSLHIGGSLANINTDLATLQYTRTTAGTGTDTLEASLVQPGQVFFSGNSHLYQYVAGPVSWTAAKTAADASTMDGASGYLATITSQSENDFIQTQLKSDSWIGASDSAAEGTWKWVDGPESGQQFWSGNGSGSIVGGSYVHWNNATTGGSGAEPNDSGSNEDCAEFYYSNNGLWNDLNCASTLGYIIEYGATGNMPAVSSKEVAITTADTTAPTKPGTPTASSPTTNVKPTVSWTASSDGGTGLANPAYTLQWSTSSTFASVAGSATTNSTSLTPSSSLADGTWYFRVIAADASGNTVNSTISSGIEVDTAAPSVPGTPSTTTPSNTAKPVWTWTASSDSGSGLASTAYSVRWSQSSTFSSGVSTGTASSASFTQPSNLTDGTWYFQVRAADLAGNTSSYSATGSVVVDTAVPSTPGAPTAASPTNNNLPTLSWTGSTDSGTGLDDPAYTLEWSQDSGFAGLGGTAGISGTSYTIPSWLALTDGTWYFKVLATDAAGNNSPWSGTLTLVVDTAAPVVTNSSAAPVADTTAAITWTTDKQASTQVAYGPTNSYGSLTTETDTSPRLTGHSVTLSGLVACTLYHYRVVSADSVGNVGHSSDASFITTGCAGSADVLAHSDNQISQSSGGSVSLGQSITVQVPAHFAADDADFQIKQIDADASLAAIGSPSGVRQVGSSVYDIRAMKNTTTAISNFANAVTITMQYTKTDIATIVESSLKIYRWDSGAGWSMLDGCAVQTANKTVTCTTPGFSTFALFGSALPPQTAPSSAKPSNRTAKTSPAAQGTADTPTSTEPLATTYGTGLPTTYLNSSASGHGQSNKAGNKHSGASWQWLPVIVVIVAGFWWFIAARKRKRRKADQ